MAIVTGSSGAWQLVAAQLDRLGHPVAKPRDLAPLLAKLRETRPQLVEERRAQTMRSVEELQARIEALSAQPGFFKRIVNWFRIPTLKGEIASLHEADSRYADSLDVTIAHVRTLLESSELAGAQAEIDVIERLRMLPAPAVVFNDVRLESTRYIHFNGAALLSAQIDHVVLTPAGVFVIETKRWSQRFVESGDFHDPFDQISRAGYLCYDLLREHFGKTRVRSIIACAGRLPDPPSDSYVKVLTPERLNGYIASFRNVELSPEYLDKLRAFFSERVASVALTR